MRSTSCISVGPKNLHMIEGMTSVTRKSSEIYRLRREPFSTLSLRLERRIRLTVLMIVSAAYLGHSEVAVWFKVSALLFVILLGLMPLSAFQNFRLARSKALTLLNKEALDRLESKEKTGSPQPGPGDGNGAFSWTHTIGEALPSEASAPSPTCHF